ncbi:MAG: HEAT repeat domain-containing protein, partial [Phycisphaerales bacterium]
IAEVTRLVREGFAQRDTDELVSLLAHADRRVRQRAQFALAARGRETTALLGDVAVNGRDRFARIHAIWALGQQASMRLRESGVLEAQTLRGETTPGDYVMPVLDDRDAELRAQAARMLGEARHIGAADRLAELCSDESSRVRAFAVMALGKLDAHDKTPFVVSLIAENNDADPFLRHAAVQSLAWMQNRAMLGELAADPAPAIRMSACLAMRKLRDERIAGFLNDPDRRIRLEAARAINDIPMPALRARLAASIARFGAMEPEQSLAEVAPPAHRFTREVWKLGRVGTRADLADTALFAREPDERKDLALPEAPRNAGNQYLSRLSGFIEAPETGDYIFGIASDDDSILFLGTGEDTATLREIATVEGYSNPGEYDGQPGQRSKPVRLEKGRRYAIRALHAEGGGGDHLSIMWRLPSGKVESPIGAQPVDRSEFPHMRRAIEACLAEGTPETAALLADFAASPANPMPMRLEALATLASWLAPAPRNRVNGAFRPIDGTTRDAAAFKGVLARKLAPLAESPNPLVRGAVNDVAAKVGVSLDPDASLRAVADARLSPAERVSSLRALATDTTPRLGAAIDAAVSSDVPELRAEARTMLLRRKDARAFGALADAAEHGTVLERQRAVEDLSGLGSAADAALAPLAEQLAAGSLDPALRLDVVRAAAMRAEGPVYAALERWKSSLGSDPIARYEAVALEGGDAARGRDVVLYHQSAVCMKCHAIGGTGGNAAPALDGVATRGDARYLLHSLVNPNEVVVQGYANAGASAMPSMQSVLSDEEIRDAVAYLKTLK